MYGVGLALVSVILCLCPPFVATKCTLITYRKYIKCQQDSTDTVPSFPQYNGTLLYMEFYGVWMIRNLDQSSFSDAPSVNQLKLQDIGLRYLSCDVFTDFTRELTILNLDDNLLEYFPACAINNLWQLTELTLRGNFITCIPDHSIPGLLQFLDVSDNRISTMGSAMSTDVHNQNTLKTLIIRGNNLRRITNELNQFETLDTLDISDNRLEWIDPDSCRLPGEHIRIINLSHNRLTGDAWKCLESLTEVKYLILSNNKIDTADDGVISGMKTLQGIDISNNMISEVRSVFKDQQNLRFVSLHHNSITNVARDIFSTGTGFSKSFNLDLSFNMLDSVEITMRDCHDCTFTIHHNKLTSVSLSSNDNSTFRSIGMSYNNLGTIPADLPPWENFNGAHNPFSTASVLELLSNIHNRSVSSVNLQNTTFMCHQPPPVPDIYISSHVTLHMQDNCVPSDFMCQLHSETSSFPQVRMFLDRNGITSLPECRLNVSVVGLSLAGNQLNVINDTYITQEMPSMEYLDIVENSLLRSDVVHILTNIMNQLVYFDMSNNNIMELPYVLIRRDYFNNKNLWVDLSSNNMSVASTIEIDIKSAYNEHFVVDMSNNTLQHTTNLITLSAFDISHSTMTVNISDNLIKQLNLVCYLSVAYYFYSSINMIFDFSRNDINTLSSVINCDYTQFYSSTILLNITKNSVLDFPTCGFLNYRCPLENLKLDFSHNFLRELPHNESCLMGVVLMLNVSHNLFTDIPRPIANSSTLRYLTMNGNEIATITRDAFIGLPNLIELDLSFNKLEVFPESVTLLDKLQKLNLAGNRILSVPNAGQLLWPYLSVFQFAGNPLICSCSTAWLRNYTLTTDFGGCAYPPELVGNSATCLATDTCNGNENVYSSKQNIQTCFGNDELLFQNQGQTLEWTLSSPYVQATPHSQTDIHVYRECKLVNNVTAIVGTTWELPLDSANDNKDQVCLTLSDDDWIDKFMECLPYDRTTANISVATTTVSSEYRSSTQQNNDTFFVTTIALSVLLVLCISGLVVCLVCRRTVRQGAAPANAARTKNVYEKDITMDTSFNSGAVGANDDTYENMTEGGVEPSNTYEEI